jgi:Na+-driven multidrug efflux pump
MQTKKITIQGVLPVQILSMLISVLAMLIDGIMINIYLGDAAQAAYGLTNPVTLLVTAYGGMLSNGVQVLVGRTSGKNDKQETQRVYSISVILALAGACLMAAAAILFSRPLAMLLGAANAEICTYTAEYLSMIALCFPIIILVLVISIFFQFYGLKKEVAVSAVLLIILDVAFNFINVTVLKGGMRGMAAASVLSYYIAFGYMFLCLRKKTDLRWRRGMFSSFVMKEIFRYGTVYLVYKLCTVLLSLSINRILSSSGSVTYLAANSILSSVALVTGAFASGIGSTATMLFSYSYGLKDEEGLKASFRKIQQVSFWINLILTVCCIAGARAIVALFRVESAELYQCAVLVIRMYAFCLIFNSVNYIYKNYDMCIEQTSKSYLICILNNFILPFAMALIIGFLINRRFLWICYAAGQGLTTILAVWLHRDRAGKNSVLQKCNNDTKGAGIR